jgi:hypothetical protein
MNQNKPGKITRHSLQLASQEADEAMLRLVGICQAPELLLPDDEVATLRKINRELEDATTRLYAMAVRGNP